MNLEPGSNALHPFYLIGFAATFVLSLLFIILYATGPVCPATPSTNRDFANRIDENFTITTIPTTLTQDQYPTVLYDFIHNPFDRFDKIYYINMDSRPDRRYEIEAELREKMHIPVHKIQRIPGVVDKFGALGCSKSHLQALLDCQARGYQNCLIVEDDLMFKFSKEHTYSQLNKFWDLHLKWDVLMISSFTRKHQKTSLDFLVKILEAQTTAGYAVHRDFLPVLIDNLQKGIQELEQHNKPPMEFCIDQYWKSLQPQNNWYTFHPVMAHQRDAYSDIEQRMVSYDDKYEVIKETQKFDYLICIKTCLPRLTKNPKQIQALQDICKNKKISYFFYYGDPNLEKPFVLDEENHTVILRCRDDYLNLCHKFGMMIYFLKFYLTVNASCCETLKGVFFTDDDIELKPQDFYNFLQARATIPYWGSITSLQQKWSDHLFTKADESPAIRSLLETQYPELLKYTIAVESCDYCPGGGFYLAKPSVLLLSQADDLFVPFPRPENLHFHKVTPSSQHDKKPYFQNVAVFDDLNVGVALARFQIYPKKEPIGEIVHWTGLQ